MDLTQRETRAYNEIKTFVSLARSVLQTKPVGMWDRLINNPGLSISDGTKTSCVGAFRAFCEANRGHMDALSFPEGTRVQFSGSIYIDMCELVSRADDEDRGIVREYLLALSALLVRDSNALELLAQAPASTNEGPDLDTIRDTIDTTTNEGQFISDLVGSLGDVVGEGGIQEGTDPQAAMMQLMSSGKLMNSVMGMKDKMETGQMSMSGMLNAFSQVVKQFEQPSATASSPADALRIQDADASE